MPLRGAIPVTATHIESLEPINASDTACMVGSFALYHIFRANEPFVLSGIGGFLHIIAAVR